MVIETKNNIALTCLLISISTITYKRCRNGNMAFEWYQYYTEVISLLSIAVVDIVAEPLGVIGERVQQQVEENGACYEESHQQYPLPGLGVGHLHEVRKPHEVAIGMNNKWGSEVSRSDEEESWVHPEDCCVGKLKHRDQEGSENVLAWTWGWSVRGESCQTELHLSWSSPPCGGNERLQRRADW